MEEKGAKIWIDDIRPVPNEEWYKVENYHQAIAAIDYFNSCENGIDIISFDHDLGEKKSGYDIAKYLVEFNIHINRYDVHSMNPVGRDNIIQLLNHYNYKKI